MRLILFAVILTVISCKQDVTPVTETSTKQEQHERVTKKDVANLEYSDFILDTRVATKIESWSKYEELNQVIEELKQANFTFFTTDTETLKVLVKELKETVPEQFNTPTILARLRAIETQFYKLHSMANLSSIDKSQMLITIKDCLESFSYLNLQLNKKVEKESQNIVKPQ